MTQERHVMVPAGYVIMKNSEEKVLAVFREHTGYMDGYWALPAGHVEKDELPAKGAIREVEEEVGVEIKLGDLNFAHLMIREAHDITGERIDIFFQTSNWSGDPRNMEPGKHREIAWINPLDPSTPMIPYEVAVYRHVLNGVSYSEWREE